MKNMIQRLFMEKLISDPEGHEKLEVMKADPLALFFILN